MKKIRFFIIGILVLGLVISSLIGGCKQAATSKLQVVTSTSLLTYIVQQVGGDLVDVASIIPPTQHPGDFDSTPGDIRKLADAKLFLVHGWPGETFVPGLISSANNPDLTLETIEVEGNWITPPVQLEATDKVAAALSEVDSENSSAYRQAATEYKNRVMAKQAEIEDRLAAANLSDVNVICAFWQAEFVGWTGLSVVATYMDANSLTPKVVQELVDQGKTENVTLIVDNLHSGRDAGAGIAEELDCTRIILSNFPGGFDDTETWEKAIDENIRLILAAIAQ